jgi:hypothetical protein
VTDNTDAVARPHHYGFVHVYLRSLTFRDVAALVGHLHRDGLAYLQHLWTDAGQRLAPDQVLAPAGLELRMDNTAEAVTALVVLPPPREPTEAYFAAVVAQRGSDAGEFRPAFFSLELGIDVMTQRPRTVACRWEPDGRHLNLGTGPIPDAEAFLAYTRQQLEEDARLQRLTELEEDPWVADLLRPE